MNSNGGSKVSVKVMNRFMVDITRKGGSIIMNRDPGTVYLKLPSKSVEALQELGYDFLRNKDMIGLVVDVTTNFPGDPGSLKGNDGLAVQVVYSLTKMNVGSSNRGELQE
jgi:hypothetical protein